MSYAEWYRQHKLEWDEETARRKIDKALVGRKAPAEKDVIKMISLGRVKKQKGKKKK